MRYKGRMRWLLLGALAALAAACGGEPVPVAPITLQRRPGQPGDRIAVRIDHTRINQVSPHQAVEVSKKGHYVDEVQPEARVIRVGSFDGEEIRLELKRRDGHLVTELGKRSDEFEQFEGLLPTGPVRPGDRWQARDFWGTWGRFPFQAPKLRRVKAACVYRGQADGVATIHVAILAQTVKGPWVLEGNLAYDPAAEMLVKVDLRGTGEDLRHVMTAERELLDR
jgi:hypothetical protein